MALAGAGNLSRAVGRGMTNPCFRIIQTHFAAGNNIGDVAAKEEVRARPTPCCCRSLKVFGPAGQVSYVWEAERGANALTPGSEPKLAAPVLDPLLRPIRCSGCSTLQV